MKQEYRERMAKLLEAMAETPLFDDRHYQEFEQLLRAGSIDKVLGAAADALTEYYGFCHSRTLLGNVQEHLYREDKMHRENLRFFALAIRSEITDFRSLRDLQERVRGANNQDKRG